MGLLTREDSTLFRQFFKEMTKLRGLSVEYIYPVDEDVTIHGQIIPDFSSVFKLDIMFETNPKINPTIKPTIHPNKNHNILSFSPQLFFNNFICF